jgi:hypothetical protein
VARQHRPGARAASLVLGAGYWSASAFWAAVSLLIAGMECDESCFESSDWRHREGAWQWDAIGALGLAGLGAATAVALFVVARRRGPAAAGLGIHALAFAGWAILLMESWTWRNDVLPVVALAAAAGLAAVALSGRERAADDGDPVRRPLRAGR